jgi:hypothetical protein
MDSAPTRSPYSEKLFENELDTKNCRPAGRKAHGHGVGLDAVGEALVGHVEEGDQAALAAHGDHFVPLRVRQVGAGRVVAAGVQHDDRAGLQAVELGLHAGEVHAAGGGVVVGVVLDREAGGLEQRAVVFPARVGDVNGGAGQQALEVVGADLERAGAAEGLGGDGLAAGGELRVLAEEQALHRVVVGGGAFDRLVAARRHGFEAGLLGGLDGGEQRDLAVVVEVHADAEVDLGRARVSALKASFRPRIGSRGPFRRRRRSKRKIVVPGGQQRCWRE